MLTTYLDHDIKKQNQPDMTSLMNLLCRCKQISSHMNAKYGTKAV